MISTNFTKKREKYEPSPAIDSPEKSLRSDLESNRLYQANWVRKDDDIAENGRHVGPVRRAVTKRNSPVQEIEAFRCALPFRQGLPALIEGVRARIDAVPADAQHDPALRRYGSGGAEDDREACLAKSIAI